MRAKWVSGRTGARTICERCYPAFLASKARTPGGEAASDPELVSWVASLAFLGHGEGRRLTQDEARAAFPGVPISADYGKPQAAPSRAGGPQAALVGRDTSQGENGARGASQGATMGAPDQCSNT